MLTCTLPAPGASVFLLTSSVFTFVLVPMCVIVLSLSDTRIEAFLGARAYLAELICARARPAHVRLECAWTAFMSIFQLGEAFLWVWPL